MTGCLTAWQSSPLTGENQGFLSGHGVFETVALQDGRPVLWSRHRRRLERGLAFLGLAVDVEVRIEAPLRAFLAGLDPGRTGKLRVTVTVDPAAAGGAHVHMAAGPAPVRDGAILVQTGIPHPGPRARPAFLKSLSYQPFVLARREAQDRGGSDGLLLSSGGFVAEADSANLFLFLPDEVLYTPSQEAGALDGVMRGVVIETAREKGLTVLECRFSPQLLAGATDMFLTSSLRRVQPVESGIFPGGPWAPAGTGRVERVSGWVESALERMDGE